MQNSVLYSWEIYLKVNDQYWYLDIISINYIFPDMLNTFLPILTLFNFTYNNMYFNTNFNHFNLITDLMVNSNVPNSSLWLYLFYTDLVVSINKKFLLIFEILNFRNLSLTSNLTYNSPELLYILNLHNSFKLNLSTYAVDEWVRYSSFLDNIIYMNTEFFVSYNMFVIFTLISILATIVTLLNKWFVYNTVFFNRLYFYVYSLSVEFRLQFDMFIQLVMLFWLYWVAMLMTFDSDQEELIELINLSFFYFFLTIITFFFFKYSHHYFSFLEASVTEGRSVLFILKQFVRDVSNTLALFLRFFLLLLRLNIYDSLDDFYDSYYIFVGDFDEDDYINEAFLVNVFNSVYSADNNTDKTFNFEEEHTFYLDFFYLYFLVWGKFFFFLFLLVEEILRVSLAVYIIYLIVLDVHAVNASYTEDMYLIKKKL